MSKALDISVATCYRRVEESAEHGLLRAQTLDEECRVAVYQRAADEVCTDPTEPVSVSIRQESQLQTALDTYWQQVS